VYPAGEKPSKRSAFHHPPKNRGEGAWENVASGNSTWLSHWPRLLTYGGVKKTVKQYLVNVRNFLRFQKTDALIQSLIPIMETAEDVDRVLTLWMEKRCYQDRRSCQDGKNARSGLLHLDPALRGDLPLASRASKTWEKLEGTLEKEPFCKAYLGLVIEALAKKNVEAGWMAFAQTDTLMREQDISRLLTSDVHCGGGNVSLELGVLERGEVTKSGTSQGVTVLHPLLKAFFRHVKATRGPSEKVFSLTIDKYNLLIHEVCAEYGLEDMEATAHRFRHSGTVLLLHDLHWPQPKVRDRGRWGHDKSMAQYMKSHLLVKNQERMSPEEQQRGHWLWERPHERLGIVNFDLTPEIFPSVEPAASSAQLFISEEPPLAYPMLPPIPITK